MDCGKQHYITDIRPFVYGVTEYGEPLISPEEIIIGIQCSTTGHWCSEEECKFKKD